MSNEISVNYQLKVQNPANSTSGYVNTVQKTLSITQNTIGVNAEIVTVPVTATQYTFPNLATEGIAYIQNLDSTNYVRIGGYSGGVIQSFMMLEAGEIAHIRLDPNGTFGMQSNLPQASAGSLSNSGSGGTILAGTYKVQISYVNASGESVASGQYSTTTSGSTSTITIGSPAATGGGLGAATGWYAYVSQAGGSTCTRQQAPGSPTAIGTSLVLTAPPTNTGATPLAVATTSPVKVNYIILND